MAKRAGGQHGRDPLRVLHHAEAKPPSRAGQKARLQLAGLHASQLGDRFVLQESVPLEHASAEQHLVELQYILRGGEKAGAA